MENAAIKAADEIVKDYGCVKDMKIQFAGKGNNGEMLCGKASL